MVPLHRPPAATPGRLARPLTALRRLAWALLASGIVIGTLRDAPRTHAPLLVNGYQVLEADFHVHAFFGDGWLAPWDLVLEARRRNLHAFAITNHNQVLAARLGRWFSRQVGGPIVLVGEEVTAPNYHIAAIGLTTTVDWNQPASGAIADIHRQGAIAIAAHPVQSFWGGYDDAALRTLDGAEAAHPAEYVLKNAMEMRAFWERAASLGAHLTAIGSSDFHALSGFGLCRTHVFVHEVSEAGIMAALHAGHTVVFDPQGQAHGEAALIEPLREALRQREPWPASDWLDALGRVCGLTGLLGLLLCSGVRVNEERLRAVSRRD
jgi:predicted metal-dependent phosphoesterase TrpH